MFYNFSTEDFVCTWGGFPYTFKAGRVYDGTVISDNGSSSVTLNEVVSKIFAKHLAEHLLNTNKEVSENRLKYNMTNMDLLTERGIQPPSSDVALPAFKEELNIQKELKTDVKPEPVVSDVVKDESEAPKRKAGRPRKSDSPSPDAQFPV